VGLRARRCPFSHSISHCQWAVAQLSDFCWRRGEVTYRIAIVYGEKSFNKFCTIHWDISKSTEVQFKQNILICISHETKVKRTRTHEIQGLMPLSLASNYFDIFMVAENGLPGAGSPLHSPQTSVKRGECLTYQDDVR